MKLVIVCGSHRQDSQTRKVCDHIARELQKKNIDQSVIDLSTAPLPFIASQQASSPEGQQIIDRFKSKMQAADGFVLATPEWDGAATPALLNSLGIASKTMAYKPSMILTVSSSRGGSYPVAELRSFGFKNNKTVFIPDHIIVHSVNDVLNEVPPKAQEPDDLYIRERIDWSLTNLILFTQSLILMREGNSTQLLDERFGNGMS